MEGPSQHHGVTQSPWLSARPQGSSGDDQDPEYPIGKQPGIELMGANMDARVLESEWLSTGGRSGIKGVFRELTTACELEAV